MIPITLVCRNPQIIPNGVSKILVSKSDTSTVPTPSIEQSLTNQVDEGEKEADPSDSVNGMPFFM